MSNDHIYVIFFLWYLLHTKLEYKHFAADRTSEWIICTGSWTVSVISWWNKILIDQISVPDDTSINVTKVNNPYLQIWFELNVLSVEVLYAQLGLQNLDIDYEYSQNCGSGMFIPDHGSEFFHLWSRIQGQKDYGSRIRIIITVFLTQKLFLSSQNHPGSLIPDPGVKKAPEPGSATLNIAGICRIRYRF
jgi:hypothetical protein